MACPWYAHGLSAGCPSTAHGLSIDCTWDANGLSVGCPSGLGRVGPGRAGPGHFLYDGPQPGPSRHMFRGWAAARPGPSKFERMGRGPAQPITFLKNLGPNRPVPHHMAARPMRHGLYTGRPDNYVGRPVDLTDRRMGRSMCCPVLKGACAYADVMI